MKINKTLVKYRSLLTLLLIMIVACTNEDDQFSNNLLVGLWVDPTNASNGSDPRYSLNCYPDFPDAGFSGTWLFKKDGSYQLDVSFGTIAGADSGYSSGTYDLISDSVLVLHVEDYKKLAVNEWDTLNVMITDTMFISRFTSEGCKLFWERIL